MKKIVYGKDDTSHEDGEIYDYEIDNIRYHTKTKWPILETLGNSFIATMELGGRYRSQRFPNVFNNLKSSINSISTKKLIDNFFLNYNNKLDIKDFNITSKNFDWENFRSHSKNKKYVYVILLHQSRLYVGYSKNIIKRLSQHIGFNNKEHEKSSAWVKKWGVKYILKVFENADEEFENELSLFLIEHYGWEWVRGGKYVQFDMESPLEE